MTQNSRDYHDYVIKDGRLVGDFDGMYRYSAEIPWHQDRVADSISADIDLAMVRRVRCNTCVDIACGLGYFTERLRTTLKTKNDQWPSVTGIDISETAVAHARNMYPQIEFVVEDIATREFTLENKYDLIVMKELIWYVCDHIDQVLVNVANLCHSGTFIHVAQSFPRTSRWVGQEVIPSTRAFCDILSNVIEIKCVCTENQGCFNGASVVHILGSYRGA